jgi:hypothetical protein
MKPSFGTLLALAMIASAPSSAWAGGGSIGSGSDGLIRTPGDAPATLGSLLVEGTPGSAQSSAMLHALRCGFDAGGRVKYATCDTAGIDFRINQPVMLHEGTYLVGLQGVTDRPGALSSLLYAQGAVTVSRNALTVLGLSRLSLARTGLAASQRVFADFGAPGMRQRFVLGYFGSGGPTEDIGLLRAARPSCQGQETFERLRRAALGEFRAILDFARPLEDGGIAWINGVDAGCRPFFTSGHVWISNAQDGGFVSVFPGTYGIESIDESGKLTVRRGLVVD